MNQVGGGLPAFKCLGQASLTRGSNTERLPKHYFSRAPVSGEERRLVQKLTRQHTEFGKWNESNNIARSYSLYKFWNVDESVRCAQTGNQS
jgi:hypothetical protein